MVKRSHQRARNNESEDKDSNYRKMFSFLKDAEVVGI
jgi:hypothetical protein